MKLAGVTMVVVVVIGGLTAAATVSRAEPEPRDGASPGIDEPPPTPARSDIAAPTAAEPDHARAAVAAAREIDRQRYLRAALDAALAGDCSRARAVVQVMNELGLATTGASGPTEKCVARLGGSTTRSQRAIRDESQRPPFSIARTLGGVSLGVVLSIPGLFVGYIAAAGVGHGVDPEDPRALWGAYTGGVIGIASGVYALGVIGNRTGSLGATLLGALVGGAASFALTYALPTRSHDGVSRVGLASAFVTPFVGALVGFNLTRRYERGAVLRVGSLVTRTNDRWSLGIPLVGRSEHTTTLSLLAGSF